MESTEQWQDTATASLPALMPASTPPHRTARYSGRDTLSPYDALLLSAPSPAPFRSSEALNQHINTHLMDLMPNGEPRTVYPQQANNIRGLSRSQPNLSLPLPLIAYAGNKGDAAPTAASASADDVRLYTSSPISRITSAPATFTTREKLKAAIVPQFYYRRIDWRRLPSPVVELVLDQLRLLHRCTTCSTCHMRDLVALQLTCKAFFSPAQKRLYAHISIYGPDPPLKLKRFKVQHGARLILLRRTLRSKPLLASLVSTLHVPDPIIPLYLPLHNDPNPAYDAYICLLASLAMTCPNLTLFTGFLPFYNHTFDRLTHALSTRSCLRQHVWIVAENADVSLRAQTQLPPGLLDQYQCLDFLTYHERWSQLETLALCSPGGLGVVEHDLFVETLHSLPRLQNLAIASFDADDFSDRALLALPHVVSLRIEECAGITDAGLAKWAACPNAVLVERLSLLHQAIASLVTIAKLCAGLERLKRLTVLQDDVEPGLPFDLDGAEGGVIIQPLFASRTLEFLHWDIACSGSDTSSGGQSKRLSANAHLALSITHNGFPRLTHLRAPRDTAPRGALQAVCRPARDGNVLLRPDKFAVHLLGSRIGVQESGQKEGGGGKNNLQLARLRAQRLIDEMARERREFMKVVVTDYSNFGVQRRKSDVRDVKSGEVEEDENGVRGRRGTGIGNRDSGGSATTRSSRSTAITEPEPDIDMQRGRDYGNGFTNGFLRDRGRIGSEDWEKEVVTQDDHLTVTRGRRTESEALLASPQGHQHTASQQQHTTPRPRADHSPMLSPPSRSPLRPGFDNDVATSDPTSDQQPSSASAAPLKIHEFSLPQFIGRISVTLNPESSPHNTSQISLESKTRPGPAIAQPPIFYLLPDLPGRDGNGGIVGWGELLKVGERAKAASAADKESSMKVSLGSDDDLVDDDDDDDEEWSEGRAGCTGAWNRANVEKRRRNERSKSRGRDMLGKSREKVKGRNGSADWWRHTERPRDERDVTIDDFF